MTSAGFAGWLNGWVHLAADGLLKLHATGRVDVRRGDERTDRGAVEQLVDRLSAQTLSCCQGEPDSYSLLSASGLPGHFRVRGGRQVLVERLSRLLGLDPAEVQSVVAVPGGDLIVLLTEWEPEEGSAELMSTARAVKSRLARGPRPAARGPATAEGEGSGCDAGDRGGDRRRIGDLTWPGRRAWCGTVAG